MTKRWSLAALSVLALHRKRRWRYDTRRMFALHGIIR